jgi:predicted ribonuclease YlaK
MGSPGSAVSGEDQPVNDAEIIDRAVYLRSLFPTGRRVILVSGDVSMEFRAEGLAWRRYMCLGT